MKTYLKIQSRGEIELGAFTLIGASTKRNDKTKIGYYGSGLKYSISALLRNSIGFKIFSGEREVDITTKHQGFREDSFEVILVNGQTTSLTTNMGGSDWDKPFAPIREIYSNALDEDENSTLEESGNTIGDIGWTTFYIEMTEDVKHFYENVSLYFSNQNETVLASNEYVSIYPAISNELRLFRKGILCFHDKDENAIFNYNSKHYDINESRVLDNTWGAKYYTAIGWKCVTNQQLIKELIDGLAGGNSGRWEHDLAWGSSSNSFSEEWGEVCRKYSFVPAEIMSFAEEEDLVGRIILPKELLVKLYRQFDDLDILGLSEGNETAKYIIRENPSLILVNKVVDALAILHDSSYKYRFDGDINIKYAAFTNDAVLGHADKGVIYLSIKLDSFSISDIAKIIIEENEHNRTGFGDKTRSFQDHLFNLYYEELIREK